MSDTLSSPTRESLSVRLDRLPFTRRHATLLTGSGIGWALDAFDVGLISFVIAQLSVTWKSDAAALSWVASAAVGGLLADKLGRELVLHPADHPIRVDGTHEPASGRVLDSQQQRRDPHQEPADEDQPGPVVPPSLDALWVLNGIVFYVLIFTTGQWMRLVPTSWDVFPNALSTAIQYASLNWPTENGWVNYNSLQLLTTVFIAAPLAVITGIRTSGAWPAKAKKLNKLYPIEVARAIHYPVMLYFVLFIIVHVTLVVATGALRNLNHMYAVRDDTSWVGFWIFAASLVIMIAVWIAAQPLFLRPIAALTGKLSRR
jgi:hypothetical protein